MFSKNPVRGGPEAGTICSEMTLSAAVPEDVPAIYFVEVWVSEHGQSVGCHDRRAALWHPGSACTKQTSPRKCFLVELRHYDAFLEFSFL